MDINTISTNENNRSLEYVELIFETHSVLPSWEDQTKKWGFFIITHEIRKPWYSFKKKVVKKKKLRHYLSITPLKTCIF